MNESTYLGRVASLTGFRHYSRQGPLGKKSGCVIGTRDGYITIIGFQRVNKQEKLVILVRFKTANDPQTIKTALSQNLQAAKMKGSLAAVGADFARWEWTYHLAKPKAEDVVKCADALREALKQMAPGFDSNCEKCQASVGDLTLWNGMPSYICAGCQERVRQSLNQAAANYETLEPNYMNGIAFAVGASLLGGIAWGVVAYGLHYIFLYGAILIGYFVAWAMLKGTGKATPLVQVLVPVLTVASVLFGDCLYFTLSVMKERELPFSWSLFKVIMTHLWQIETTGGNIASVIFALIGAGFAVFQARKPKFQASFEPLGVPEP